MSTLVRFAPSPTGLLHVGNARTALVNWLFTRNNGGRFLLRLDDTDLERSTDSYAAAIRTDLRWLGLHWDDEVRQSDRLGRYAETTERLRAQGLLYPCFETPDELALKRKSLLGRGLPPIYDRAGLLLTDTERKRMEAEGRQPHWRFRLSPDPVTWTDLIRGPVRITGSDLSDPVLIREDGRPLYTLCSVVDDGDFSISDVLRGEDHITNTAVQLQLFKALGLPRPRFGHLSLLTDAAGQGLSKRLGSISLSSLRDNSGIEPMAVNSYLARLGTSDVIEPYAALGDLVATFDIESFSRATPRFDLAELERLNHRLLLTLSFEAVAHRLRALGMADVDAAFWYAIRPNLTTLGEARAWWEIVRQPVRPVIADANLTQGAADLLPPEPWDETTWKIWIQDVTRRTGAKGKALYLPLRQALTGRDHGPDLKSLLPLLGRDRAVARLRGETA